MLKYSAALFAALCSALPAQGPESATVDRVDMDRVEIRVPVSTQMQADEVKPGEYRPVLHVTIDGTMIADETTLFSPAWLKEREDPYGTLRSWMTETAKKMRKEHLFPDQASGPMVAADRLLIRADENTLFLYVGKIMETGGTQGVFLSKFQFAVDHPRADETSPQKQAWSGKLDAFLPRDVGHFAEPIERIEVSLRVGEAGTKRMTDGSGKPWDGQPGSRYAYDPETRRLEYSVGPRKMREPAEIGEVLEALHRNDPDRGGVIDVGKGTLFGEVVGVMDLLLASEYPSIGFALGR